MEAGVPTITNAGLASLFESGHLGELQAWGTTRLLRSARELLADRFDTESPTVGEVLDAAFTLIARQYPVEYVFKSCALQRLLYGRHSPNTTAFYTEFNAGASRADVLIVNGSAHVFEIKTRYDDFSRLSSQLDSYYRTFTRVTVFTDDVHAAEAAATTPSHVGVSVLSPRYSISTHRSAAERTEDLSVDEIFRVLREDEYLGILDAARGLDLKAVDPAVRYHYARKAFGDLRPEFAYAQMIAALKARQATVRLSELSSDLPRSLRLAPFAYRMAAREWRALADVARTVA